MKNFNRTAAGLLSGMAKIDSNYYPETLHRMFIVNAGSAFKMLYATAKKFLDPKTISKIQVLEHKSSSKLLETIDSSQLPDFLGGLCTCSAEGGCLKSNKGPWNDPEIMRLVHDAEANFVRQSTRTFGEEQRTNSYKIRPLKGRSTDTSAAESGSDVDDLCSPIGVASSGSIRLAPVHEEVRASDPTAYYSCDDHFSVVDKAVDCSQGVGSFENRSFGIVDRGTPGVKHQSQKISLSIAPNVQPTLNVALSLPFHCGIGMESDCYKHIWGFRATCHVCSWWFHSLWRGHTLFTTKMQVFSDNFPRRPN